MLHRITELLDAGETFSFETTLATKSYKSKVIAAQQLGYKVILLFFWLEDVNLAIERVKTRVSEGGHNIQIDVIKRRYTNGIKNLFDIYLPVVNEAIIFDNSFGMPQLIAEMRDGVDMNVIDKIKFEKLQNY